MEAGSVVASIFKYLFYFLVIVATRWPSVNPFCKNILSNFSVLKILSFVMAEAPNAEVHSSPPTIIIPKINIVCNRLTCASSSPADMPPAVTNAAPILSFNGVKFD